jgi:hypothetical protein
VPTYLYCILAAPAEAPPPGLTGVDAGAVRVLRCGAVDAWVSSVERAPGRPAADSPRADAALAVARARAHDGVSVAAMGLGATPLPARFGQSFPSDAACAAHVARRAAALQAALKHVAGRVEMSTYVTLAAAKEAATPAPPAAPAASAGASAGRAYLEHLRSSMRVERNVHHELAAVRRRITETVGALVCDEVVAAVPSPPAAPCFRLAHLISRAAVSDYRSRLSALGADSVRGLRVIGPSPPYSFAESRGG